MRREVADVVGSGLLLAALVAATVGVATGGPAAATETSLDTMVAPQLDATRIERGRSLFYTKGCASCHFKEGRPIADVGPDLRGLSARAASRRPGLGAEAYVRESIGTPSAFIAPGIGGNASMPDLGLRDDEIDALVAFLLGTP